MPFCSGTELFVLDGSGAQNPRVAAAKRPLYHLQSNGPSQSFAKVPSTTGLWVDYFSQWLSTAGSQPAWLLVDVALGLPADPSDVWTEAQDFPSWLELQWQRGNGCDWRTWLIADSWSARTAQRPFVKVRRGEKHLIASKRRCDQRYQAESVYCIDAGATQVGRASLQFWFECLMPLRARFPGRIAIWPFESLEGARLVVAECYPAICQVAWGLPKGSKRDLEFRRRCMRLVRAQCRVRFPQLENVDWNGPTAHEDDWDVFLTGLSFASGAAEIGEPIDCEVLKKEGWILAPKFHDP